MEHRNSPAEEVKLKTALLTDLLEMNGGRREEQVSFCQAVKAGYGLVPT